ncbi:hypothetical protein OHAE_631 [Ochrobactrum soli]|uniref:Uncharacterized protein n=1 Tax=Ochrobactrum soli TaxID=2448455 RepID=A0A2P9HKV0_9HYPH|nr:hypothetical protein OHAE_631 [[Ochrobactrum] soli]
MSNPSSNGCKGQMTPGLYSYLIETASRLTSDAGRRFVILLF